MGEFAGELMALLADGVFRKWHVARTRRRLAAGRKVKVPCSARTDRPGWPAEGYTGGHLRITPGATAVAFTSRELETVELAVGGDFHEPEPDTWHDQDWAATSYLEPGAEGPVFLQVDSRYLPMIHLALTDPARLRQL
ncbi:hypothetical protein ACWGB8_30930 [Kitasatospora sp. NPDC054939]